MSLFIAESRDSRHATHIDRSKTALVGKPLAKVNPLTGLVLKKETYFVNTILFKNTINISFVLLTAF